MKRFRFINILLILLLLLFVPSAFAAGQLSPLFTKRQPGGIFGVIDTSRTMGDIWYVDSGEGTDTTGCGRAPLASACATLDYAVGLTTASNGDIIYVAAGHAETLSTADGVDVDVAGLRIVGLGEGNNRPTFTYSATAGEFVIGAANVTVENMRFVAGISSITMGISVEAAGDNFTLRNCEFPKPTTNSFEFLDTIDVADGANNITIENCIAINDEGGAAPNHFIDAGNGTAGPERLRVVGNYIKGDFAVAAIWSDEPCDEVFIADNVIINHTTGQHCIEFTDTGTGAIVNNMLYGDTEGAILDPGSMYIAGNKISTAIDLDGIPRWVIDNGLNHLCALDGATQVYPENAVDDSILAKLMTKSDPANMSDYNNATDSLEALADAIISIDAQINVAEANGEADVDASEADYTGYTNLITITAPAGGLMGCTIALDVNKATTGLDTVATAADTFDFALVGQIDGTNYRTLQNATQITANGDGSLENSESGVFFDIGPLQANMSVQVHVKLSTERGDAELPYRVTYIGAAPTITAVAIP